MSNGPIEFLSDRELQEVPASEYGGADGLIQPALVPGRRDVEGHSVLTPSEVNGVMKRAGELPLLPYEQVTGESLSGEVVVDPVSGRVLDPDASDEVTGNGGKLSDLKP